MKLIFDSIPIRATSAMITGAAITRWCSCLLTGSLLAVSATLLHVRADEAPPSSYEGGGNYSITNVVHDYGQSTPLTLGEFSNNNTLTISGSTLTFGTLRIGAGIAARDGEGNTVTVMEGAAKRTVYLPQNNHLVITGGSTVKMAGVWETAVGTYSGLVQDSSIRVSGAGTSLEFSGNFGSSTTMNCHGAPLIIEDGAVVMVASVRNHQASKPYQSTPIYLDGGFYAVKSGSLIKPAVTGSVDALADTGKTNWSVNYFHYIDGTNGDWTKVTSEDDFYAHFSVNYYATEEAAEAATGYKSLAGYTVIASLAMVPEPAACAFVVGLAVAGFAVWRRRG